MSSDSEKQLVVQKIEKLAFEGPMYARAGFNRLWNQVTGYGVPRQVEGFQTATPADQARSMLSTFFGLWNGWPAGVARDSGGAINTMFSTTWSGYVTTTSPFTGTKYQSLKSYNLNSLNISLDYTNSSTNTTYTLVTQINSISKTNTVSANPQTCTGGSPEQPVTCTEYRTRNVMSCVGPCTWKTETYCASYSTYVAAIPCTNSPGTGTINYTLSFDQVVVSSLNISINTGITINRLTINGDVFSSYPITFFSFEKLISDFNNIYTALLIDLYTGINTRHSGTSASPPPISYTAPTFTPAINTTTDRTNAMAGTNTDTIKSSYLSTYLPAQYAAVYTQVGTIMNGINAAWSFIPSSIKTSTFSTLSSVTSDIATFNSLPPTDTSSTVVSNLISLTNLYNTYNTQYTNIIRQGCFYGYVLEFYNNSYISGQTYIATSDLQSDTNTLATTVASYISSNAPAASFTSATQTISSITTLQTSCTAAIRDIVTVAKSAIMNYSGIPADWIAPEVTAFITENPAIPTQHSDILNFRRRLFLNESEPCIIVGGDNISYKSKTGTAWTQITNPVGGPVKKFGYNGRIVIAINQNISYSYDGINWTIAIQNPFGAGTSCNGIAWNGTMWAVVGRATTGTNSVAYSTDGITWTVTTVRNADVAYILGDAIAWDAAANKWLILGRTPIGSAQDWGVAIGESFTNQNWTITNIASGFRNATGIAVGYVSSNKTYVVCGPSVISGGVSSVYYSTNGTAWTGVPTAKIAGIALSVIYQNNTVVVGFAGETKYSTDLSTWTTLGTGISSSIDDLQWDFPSVYGIGTNSSIGSIYGTASFDDVIFTWRNNSSAVTNLTANAKAVIIKYSLFDKLISLTKFKLKAYIDSYAANASSSGVTAALDSAMYKGYVDSNTAPWNVKPESSTTDVLITGDSPNSIQSNMSSLAESDLKSIFTSTGVGTLASTSKYSIDSFSITISFPDPKMIKEFVLAYSVQADQAGWLSSPRFSISGQENNSSSWTTLKSSVFSLPPGVTWNKSSTYGSSISYYSTNNPPVGPFKSIKIMYENTYSLTSGVLWRIYLLNIKEYTGILAKTKQNQLSQIYSIFQDANAAFEAVANLRDFYNNSYRPGARYLKSTDLATTVPYASSTLTLQQVAAKCLNYLNVDGTVKNTALQTGDASFSALLNLANAANTKFMEALIDRFYDAHRDWTTTKGLTALTGLPTDNGTADKSTLATAFATTRTTYLGATRWTALISAIQGRTKTIVNSAKALRDWKTTAAGTSYTYPFPTSVLTKGLGIV